MYKNSKLLNDIKKYLEEERRKALPEIEKGELCENGKIYFMNGKNGTAFEFRENNSTPAFAQFYKNSEMGCIKVYLYKDGFLSGYFWHDGEMYGKATESLKICTPEKARAFSRWLNNQYDRYGIFNCEV